MQNMSEKGVKSAVVYGGTPMQTDKEMLKDFRKHVLVIAGPFF